jgi:hypothetical protein
MARLLENYHTARWRAQGSRHPIRPDAVEEEEPPRRGRRRERKPVYSDEEEEPPRRGHRERKPVYSGEEEEEEETVISSDEEKELEGERFFIEEGATAATQNSAAGKT